MFIVLYPPFDGVHFERSKPYGRSKAVLVYEGPKGKRVLISTARLGDEPTTLEIVADFLNVVPSLEFSRPMLRCVREVWRDWKKGHESKLLRTLHFSSVMGLDKRQPPFAPNNGSRLDGIW